MKRMITHLCLLLLISGVAEAEVLMYKEDTVAADRNTAQETPPPLVEKEILMIRTSADLQQVIVPYKERRQRWSYLLSLGYSLYTPDSYQPNFQPDFSYDGLYEGSGLFEAKLTKKLNFAGGSIGLGLSGGFFKATSKSGAPAESSLTVIPVSIEASVHLDGILAEPYIAPYGFVGLYSKIYSEKQSANVDSESGVSFNGNTAAALYVGGGINFQLYWIEPLVALSSYIDYGIENTFLYVEGKKFMTSSSESDPDFETSFELAAGARFEF